MARLVVELTDRCNLRCGHCPAGRHGGRGALTLDLLALVLAQGRASGLDQLSFTGGEPLLHPQFGTVVARTAAAGYRFGLVTNGWFLPQRLGELLPHRGSLDMITFSCDGALEATHDALRGAGAFRRMLQGVSACVRFGLPFNFNMILTRHNWREAQLLASLARRLGALGLRCGHLLSHPDTGALELSPAERREVDRWLQDLQARSDFPIALAPGGYTRDLFPCAPLRAQEYNLDWRGTLGLCCHLSGADAVAAPTGAGNLRRVPLPRALAGLRVIRTQLRADKAGRRGAADGLADGGFPCWDCARRCGLLAWLRDQPQHPWYGYPDDPGATVAA